jgi:hypothetical protein
MKMFYYQFHFTQFLSKNFFSVFFNVEGDQVTLASLCLMSLITFTPMGT